MRKAADPVRLIVGALPSETSPTLVDGLIERRVGGRLWSEFRA